MSKQRFEDTQAYIFMKPALDQLNKEDRKAAKATRKAYLAKQDVIRASRLNDLQWLNFMRYSQDFSLSLFSYNPDLNYEPVHDVMGFACGLGSAQVRADADTLIFWASEYNEYA